MKIIFLIFLLVVMLVFVLVFSPRFRQFLPFSVGTHHLLNLIKPSQDLYKPIIFENFNFDQKGLVARYDIKADFFDFYTLAIVLEEPKIEAGAFSDFAKKLVFKGRIKVEFFYKNTLLSMKEIISSEQVIKMDNGSVQVNLFNFPIPIAGKYSNDLSIKIEVLDSDNSLSSFAKRTKVLIGVNGIP